MTSFTEAVMLNQTSIVAGITIMIATNRIVVIGLEIVMNLNDAIQMTGETSTILAKPNRHIQGNTLLLWVVFLATPLLHRLVLHPPESVVSIRTNNR
jgi:hypothetical protein